MFQSLSKSDLLFHASNNFDLIDCFLHVLEFY